MSDRSPLSKAARAAILLSLAVAAGSAVADGSRGSVADDPLLRYRTTALHHGLYEVNVEASRFLRGQPQKKSGPWIAAGPDIRMQLPRCAVPLRSRWAKKSDNTEALPGVLVICKNTVNKKDPSWATFLHAYVDAERKLEVRRRFPGFLDERASESK